MCQKSCFLMLALTKSMISKWVSCFNLLGLGSWHPQQRQLLDTTSLLTPLTTSLVQSEHLFLGQMMKAFLDSLNLDIDQSS